PTDSISRVQTAPAVICHVRCSARRAVVMLPSSPSQPMPVPRLALGSFDPILLREVIFKCLGYIDCSTYRRAPIIGSAESADQFVDDVGLHALTHRGPPSLTAGASTLSA